MKSQVSILFLLVASSVSANNLNVFNSIFELIEARFGEPTMAMDGYGIHSKHHYMWYYETINSIYVGRPREGLFCILDLSSSPLEDPSCSALNKSNPCIEIGDETLCSQ